MAKNAITDYSETAASNTDVGGIGIVGTAAVSNMDNAVREIMADLAAVNKGSAPVADTWTFADPADLTKRARLDAGGVTAGQTRVLASPDYDGTIATLAGTETFSNKTLNAPNFSNPPTGLDASETAKGIIEIATAAEYRNPASNVLALTPGRVKDAMAEVSLTDAATIAWDMSAGFDFTVTLTASRTLGNPTNTTVGKRGRIRVVQNGTGGWTLTKSSNHKTPGGAALTIASAAAAETYIYYDCVSSTKILLSNSQLAWS